MIYIENTTVRTEKSADYLGNAGLKAALFGTSLSLLMIGAAAANEASQVPASRVIDEAQLVDQTISLIGLDEEVIVSGDFQYDGYFLGARRIVFEPGARLIFSQAALDARNSFVIAAHTIEMRDQQQPGVITWDAGAGPEAPPPSSGQAPTGRHGAGHGESGGAGSAGGPGSVGREGRNAPSITLFVVRLEGAPPAINLRGQIGGQGGRGQAGGDGGVGFQGAPASADVFNCRRGAGFGGAGGNGGSGGQGGRGGQGGAGGIFTIVSVPDAFPTLTQLVRVDVAGGAGGQGGAGGPGGRAGPGGAPGAPSLPYCRAEPGRAGAPGNAGSGGSTGPAGPAGVSGDFFFTTMTEERLNRLFGL